MHSMSSTDQTTAHDASTPNLRRRVGGLVAAAVLAIFGVAAVVQGLDGRATVRDALGLEKVVGEHHMTPAAIAKMTSGAGLHDVALPTCSVAGKPIDNGTDARCFAEYMRVDALTGTHGATYAQMPRFATKDNKGTNDATAALTYPNGEPMNNPARQVWVTETALSTALNTSYMAEQISLFGIAVGAAFLLVAMAIAGVALSGLRLPATAPALPRRRQASRRAEVPA
jgi:hypothetical protein